MLGLIGINKKEFTRPFQTFKMEYYKSMFDNKRNCRGKVKKQKEREYIKI